MVAYYYGEHGTLLQHIVTLIGKNITNYGEVFVQNSGHQKLASAPTV